jgi:hypothetical protein
MEIKLVKVFVVVQLWILGKARLAKAIDALRHLSVGQRFCYVAFLVHRVTTELIHKNERLPRLFCLAFWCQRLERY